MRGGSQIFIELAWTDPLTMCISRGNLNTSVILVNLIFKSPATMWWWRLIVFAASARRRHSDYFQIFAVCILALGNLPGKFFFCVFQFFQQNPRWPPKSYSARYSLNRFIDLFHVWFEGKTLPWP